MENTEKEPQKELKQKPPKKKDSKFVRGKDGLLQGITYVYKEDGTVNWRKMVKQTSLYPNILRTRETDVSKITNDADLLIDLEGLRELARLRGYNFVDYEVFASSIDFVCVKCTIEWLPNYETDFKQVSFSALADTSAKNTTGFASNFLTAIAENRAFARAVRNFLNINIVSKEEMKQGQFSNVSGDPTEEVEMSMDPISAVKTTIEEKKIEWRKVKEQLIKFGVEGAENFESIDDLKAPSDALTLLGYLTTVK